MRMRTDLIAVCLLLATPALAAPPFGAKNIRHLTVRADLLPPEVDPVDPDAEGRFRLMLRQQGGADIQKLQIKVRKLEAEMTYQLLVLLRGDVALTPVGSFDTDADGAAHLKFKRSHENGAGFPVELDPLVDVLSLEVQNGLAETVLAADLSEPERFQYLVKRALDNEGFDLDAAGRLFLKGHPGKTLFRLQAGNLEPNTDYTLAINGAVVIAAVHTDDDGRLQIKDLPDGAPSALEMLRVELRLGTDPVLGTDLP